MTDNFFNTTIATIILTAVGYGIIQKTQQYWKKLRNQPFLVGIDKPEEAKRKITINLPPIWIPRRPSDTEESITQQFRPDIALKKDHWLITFKPLTVIKNGISLTYKPKPQELPLTPTLDQAILAAKLVPSVMPTINPAGWDIKFPKWTILA